MEKAYFDFYGVKLALECGDGQTRSNIQRDFAYFWQETPLNAQIKINIYLEKPPFERVPPLKASLYNPDSICYDNGPRRYVDYQGKALSVYDYKNEIGEIYTEDKVLLHELSYLLILSRVGELLDKKGIHRIHALGIAIENKGILCLLPQGAGKSTLALELLKNKQVNLLSDDTVLLNKHGQLLAFPLRLGISPQVAAGSDIPAKYLRSFPRRKYGDKTLIDIDYFKDRIAPSARPEIILIGERVFSDEAKISQISKIKAIGPIIRDAVIGLGLAQMVEYFLRWNFRDIFAKINMLLSRLLVSFKLLIYSKTYRFLISRDRAKNVEVLLSFLEKRD